MPVPTNAHQGGHKLVSVLVREDQRWTDLEDVLVSAGASDQDSLVAELVDDALGLLRGGELDADE